MGRTEYFSVSDTEENAESQRSGMARVSVVQAVGGREGFFQKTHGESTIRYQTEGSLFIEWGGGFMTQITNADR